MSILQTLSLPVANLLQTLPDYVVATSIIKHDGTQVDLRREDDPEGFALKVVHFGLLGITICEIYGDELVCPGRPLGGTFCHTSMSVHFGYGQIRFCCFYWRDFACILQMSLRTHGQITLSSDFPLNVGRRRAFVRTGWCRETPGVPKPEKLAMRAHDKTTTLSHSFRQYMQRQWQAWRIPAARCARPLSH